MMGAARGGSLNALTKVILNTVKHNGSVIDGIYLCPCQGHRVLIISHQIKALC